MKWYRMYHEMLDDPKVQLLPPVLFKHWSNLLALASQSESRGTLPDLKTIAFRLKTPERKMAAALEQLVAAGLIDRVGEALQPHNWNGRQRVTDDVAKRVSKHREAVTGNATVTLQETLLETHSPLLTDTDTDTEKEENANAAAMPPSAPAPKPTNGRPPSDPVNESYRLFQVLCEELGANESAATEGEKKKQLGLAKQLIADGITEDDVRGCLRYLVSQKAIWRGGFIDLATVRSEVGKWRMAGRPEREPTPLRPPKPRVATI